MGLLTDGERSEKAGSLKSLRTRAQNLINNATSLKTDLTGLKSVVNTDVNGAALYYTADDVSDIQSVIDWLNTQLGNL